VKEAKSSFLFKILALTFCLIWLTVIHILNELPLDAGDGVMHFNISQASWTNSNLFIHHWGKPLFILLSSTFAQFGMDGMVFFNILVFGLTTIFGWKILNHFSVSTLIQCSFPIILISVFDYSSTILAGLTEPLFSFFIMIASWLLITKKWFWFAIVVSFIPFLRSEGQLAIVLAGFVLFFAKEFKYIPLLLVGFILYAIIGQLIIGDFWWYFTTSPYYWDNAIYGYGNWYDYLKSFRQFLGLTGLILMLFGIAILLKFLKKKEWDKIQFNWLFFVSGIFLGVVFIHSYFWANGVQGSLGLTRIATQGMPSFILITLYYASKIELSSLFSNVRNVFFLGLLVTLPLSTILSSRFPVEAEGLDLEVLNAAKFLKDEKIEGQKIFFHHPLFVFEMGGNPMKLNQPFVFYFCNGLKNDLGDLIKPGDLIIRDSHFGPQEAGMHLKDFENCKDLVKIKRFVSSAQFEDRYNEIEGITIYQYIPKVKAPLIPFKKEINVERKFKFLNGQEFLDLNDLFSTEFTHKLVRLELYCNESDIKFVVYNEYSKKYQSVDIELNKITSHNFSITELTNTKIYFWNPNKKKCVVEIKLLSIESELSNPIININTSKDIK